MNSLPPLRILYVEDNPLIVFHVQALVEDLGHVFVCSVNSLCELKGLDRIEVDGALVDINLADGCTGPEVVAWLRARGIPSIFVTGQERIASEYSQIALGTLLKPIDPLQLSGMLELFRLSHRDRG